VAVVFTYRSPAGDQGFPGALDVEVTYRLQRRANELSIEYRARSDAKTILNLTNHGFFNLRGAGSGTIGDHCAWIDADRYAEVDDRKIPTGRLLPVAGTVLDFRRPAPIAAQLRVQDPLLRSSGGFDHSLAFRRASGGPRRVAWFADPRSGRHMEVLTSEPSVQFKSGNGFDGADVGGEGVAYPRYAGFAFETQHLPDSPNQPGFPSTTLRPGQTFRSTTILRFSVLTEPARGCARVVAP
jgi:aldose 1-epimerase